MHVKTVCKLQQIQEHQYVLSQCIRVLGKRESCPVEDSLVLPSVGRGQHLAGNADGVVLDHGGCKEEITVLKRLTDIFKELNLYRFSFMNSSCLYLSSNHGVLMF